MQEHSEGSPPGVAHSVSKFVTVLCFSVQLCDMQRHNATVQRSPLQHRWSPGLAIITLTLAIIK